MLSGKYSKSLIYKRHSVRKYGDAPVTQEQTDHILHAAMAAPSAHNKQPWSFVVIDKRELLDKIAESHPYAKMMRSASFAIVPCVIREIAKTNPFYPQDLAASVENMLIAAAECGLGSCWCGVHPNEDIEKIFVDLLNIPENLFPFAVLAFGPATEEPVPSDRFDQSRIHYNAW
ncbi:MAG: nitroreductase family protein [Synergistaceae bacterium]|jgi:nitroreductase|nr:nitroreductase family protein [Synergistaceae bacterium]